MKGCKLYSLKDLHSDIRGTYVFIPWLFNCFYFLLATLSFNASLIWVTQQDSSFKVCVFYRLVIGMVITEDEDSSILSTDSFMHKVRQ